MTRHVFHAGAHNAGSFQSTGLDMQTDAHSDRFMCVCACVCVCVCCGRILPASVLATVRLPPILTYGRCCFWYVGFWSFPCYTEMCTDTFSTPTPLSLSRYSHIYENVTGPDGWLSEKSSERIRYQFKRVKYKKATTPSLRSPPPPLPPTPLRLCVHVWVYDPSVTPLSGRWRCDVTSRCIHRHKNCCLGTKLEIKMQQHCAGGESRNWAFVNHRFFVKLLLLRFSLLSSWDMAKIACIIHSRPNGTISNKVFEKIFKRVMHCRASSKNL